MFQSRKLGNYKKSSTLLIGSPSCTLRKVGDLCECEQCAILLLVYLFLRSQDGSFFSFNNFMFLTFPHLMRHCHLQFHVFFSPKSKKVTVRLVDLGISLQAISSDDLLELAAEFSVFPSQAVEVRIANLVPYDYDVEWDKNSINNVKRWLQNNCTENVYIEGTIQWSSCLNTIWVDTIQLTEKLSTATDIFVLSLRRKLLENKFGIVDEQCLSSLKRMATSCGRC